MLPEPHPGGEELLTKLISFISVNEAGLLSGNVTLRLSPRAVEYITARLASLDELRGLKSAAPVDFLRGCVSNLSDYKRLERLTFLRNVRSLIVEPFLGALRDPTPLQLYPFVSLTSLELRSCDLSFCTPAGLDVLQQQLETIRVTNSLEKLSHLLSPRHDVADTRRPPEPWPSLSSLNCAGNVISAMEPCLKLAPALMALDLSRNHVASVTNLSACTRLVEIKLGCNNLTDCSALSSCPSLERVSVSWNGITALRGLERLKSLRYLDARGNRISQLAEVERLGALPSFDEVLLGANPIACVPGWRVNVLACFPSTHERLVVDGEVASPGEQRRVKSIVRKRAARKEAEAQGLQQFPPAQNSASGSESQADTSSITGSVGSPQDDPPSGSGRAHKSKARVVEFGSSESIFNPIGAARGGAQSSAISRPGDRPASSHAPPPPSPPSWLGAAPQPFKARFWDQLQAFVDGQQADTSSPQRTVAETHRGLLPAPKSAVSARHGSPPRFDKAVMERVKTSSSGAGEHHSMQLFGGRVGEAHPGARSGDDELSESSATSADNSPLDSTISHRTFKGSRKAATNG